ncbi:MAG: hypothetical protein ACE37B_22925 [Ilumatobacter sp.]|uniref:hypothetical protein n=1 Tax=Ilumatobacter sp. TaxID=1967498 RepID=UPI00391D32D6
MRLRFEDHDEADEQAFAGTREALLDEVYEALQADGRSESDADEIAGSIGVLLDWRFNYSDGRLDDWHLHDLTEFLLDWLPRKYSAPPEEGGFMCAAVAEFFVHMGARQRLVGGADRAAALVALAHELLDVVVEAMGDPANFGMAKSMFALPLAGADGNPLADIAAMVEAGMDLDGPEMRALIEERMEAFNALPFDDRKAVTDRSFAPPPTPRIALPVVDIAPTDAEIEISIGASRLISMIDRLVEHVGAAGIAVTQAGNLRLADARELVDLLDTGDEVERHLPWRDEPETARSSTDLPVLTHVADVAEAAGAFIRLKTKLKVDPQWTATPLVERAVRVVDALLDIGPVSSTARFEFAWELATLLEDGVPHWLVMGIPAEARVDVADVIDQTVAVVDDSLVVPPLLLADADHRRRYLAREVHAIFDALHDAGVVEWGGRDSEFDEYGRAHDVVGWFRLTPLGRLTMIGRMRDAGYDFPTLADLGDATADDLVNAIATTDVDPAELVGRWRSDTPVAERAAALAEFAMRAEEPTQRLTAASLFGELEPVEDVGPVVRQLLDSPIAGYAAMYLLEHDLATPDEMDGFMGVAPLVDLLSTLLDEPNALAELFAEATGPAGADLLEEIWRHDQPETAEILDALGAHLDDKRLAKSARKAAIRHRSWLANLVR